MPASDSPVLCIIYTLKSTFGTTLLILRRCFVSLKNKNKTKLNSQRFGQIFLRRHLTVFFLLNVSYHFLVPRPPSPKVQNEEFNGCVLYSNTVKAPDIQQQYYISIYDLSIIYTKRAGYFPFLPRFCFQEAIFYKVYT